MSERVRDGADKPRSEGEESLDDATIVVPNGDATIAVPVDDATIVSRTDDGIIRASISAPGRSGAGGAPVEEPKEIPPALAKLFFKNPLDPKRRAPESPFPKEQSSLPRGGVRASMPVVYGTRAEELESPAGDTEFSRWIGPPPAGYELAPADRSALPSTARFNRRFRLLATLGGAGVVVLTVSGLWVIITLLIGG